MCRRRAVLGRDGTLQDTDSLRVLVEDGLDILRLPERVLRFACLVINGVQE